MPRSREIQEHMRNKIVDMYQSGKGYNTISKALGLQRTPVRAIIHKLRKLGTVVNLLRSGRPTKIKSNQIKSLLLSHHHSTSALVSEILMSVLQTVQKNNRQFTYGQTVQKNNNRQFTYGQTVQKNNNRQFTYGQTVQKTALEHLQCSRQCKKKQQQFTYGQTVKKSNSNLHMDSTYLQTVQKTMCKIHIHILNTHSVL